MHEGHLHLRLLHRARVFHPAIGYLFLSETYRISLRGFRLQKWPMFLHHHGSIFVKKPDLVFCLDADPEILQARKEEVSFEECTRQREAYRELASNLLNGHVIDASQPLEKVVQDVQRIVLEYMAGRTKRRMHRSASD